MSRAKRTRQLVALFIAVAIASAALGAVGAIFIKSPAQVAADTAPPKKTVLAASVTEGTITDTLRLAGTVALGNTIAITPSPPMNGASPVVTKVPFSAGTEFQPGTSIIEIADRPLIVLPGQVPLIRDLSKGMTGEDVTRFQQALSAVGLHIEDRAGVFGWSTSSAVTQLYRNAGYKPPTAGDSVLVSRSEIALIPMEGTGRVTTLGAGLGATASSAAITVTTLPPQVSATVNTADAARLIVGMAVSAQVGDSSLSGKVAAIGAPVQDPTSGIGNPISITLDKPVPPSAIGGSAQIAIQLNPPGKPGLKVPLAAIYSDSHGGTAIALLDHGKQESVPVTVVATGDGFAAITDASGRITSGAKVRVGVGG